MTPSTTLAILVALVGSDSPSVIADDRVDRIEVNHVYDDQGQHVFDQILFYEWSPRHGRFQLQAWRLFKTPAQVPVRDHRKGEYQAVWQDGTVLRKVRAGSYRETWTQFDRELVERAYLARNRRRELSRLGAWAKLRGHE